MIRLLSTLSTVIIDDTDSPGNDVYLPFNSTCFFCSYPASFLFPCFFSSILFPLLLFLFPLFPLPIPVTGLWLPMGMLSRTNSSLFLVPIYVRGLAEADACLYQWLKLIAR